MRGTFFAGALAAGVLLAGAGPAIASGGGNDTSAKLRKAVSVDGIRFHQGAFNVVRGAQRRQPARRDAGPRALGGLRRADTSSPGYRTSRQDFTYDLYLLGDWKPPILDVKRGKSYIPGIGGSQFGGDFGSMVNSPSGDVTGPVWAADLSLAVSGGEHVDLGMRGGGLRRACRRARSC
jgi:hypothetical protein